MKNTCENCRHWRIKSDEWGICDCPNWMVRNFFDEEATMRLLQDLPEKERAKRNLVRSILGMRTHIGFGCNQFEEQ